MSATIEGSGVDAADTSSLEAEVAAWRSKRNLRPRSTIGKVPVVRIHRRTPPASWSGPPRARAIQPAAR